MKMMAMPGYSKTPIEVHEDGEVITKPQHINTLDSLQLFGSEGKQLHASTLLNGSLCQYKSVNKKKGR